MFGLEASLLFIVYTNFLFRSCIWKLTIEMLKFRSKNVIIDQSLNNYSEHCNNTNKEKLSYIINCNICIHNKVQQNLMFSLCVKQI